MHNKKLKSALYNVSWHLSYCYETKVFTVMAASTIQLYILQKKQTCSIVGVSLPFVSLHLCFFVWLRLCVLVQACLRVQVYTVIYHADV